MTTTLCSTTAQDTLAATEVYDAAYRAALQRIEEIMMPAARALAGTRTGESPYMLEHELDLSNRAPFQGRTVLRWQDVGRWESAPVRAPYDGSRPSYSVQIVLPPGSPNFLLAELARIAAAFTADLVAEYSEVKSNQVAHLQRLTDELSTIAR